MAAKIKTSPRGWTLLNPADSGRMAPKNRRRPKFRGIRHSDTSQNRPLDSTKNHASFGLSHRIGCFVSTPKLKPSAAENLLSFNRNTKRVSDRENLSPRKPQAREQHFLQLLETAHLTTRIVEVVGTSRYYHAPHLHKFVYRVH